MKKLLLSVLVLCIAVGAGAQDRLANSINAAQKKLPKKIRDIRMEVLPAQTGSRLVAAPNPFVTAQSNLRAAETVIGRTWYDLMCNYGCPGDRVVSHGDGTISAVWTMDYNGTAGFPDRGTGYNYFDGSSWGAIPTTRIESARKGWPQIAGTDDGVNQGESIISHTGLFVNTRANKGSGTWAEQDLALTGTLFPRLTSGGANGTSLHVLATPDAPFNGIRYGITYNRSIDGGLTWNITDGIIPGLDSTNFVDVLVDSYDLDAVGDDIAIVLGGSFTLCDLTLFRSADNGDTWTRTVISPSPLGPLYDPLNGISDVDGDGIADTISWIDGGYDILIDHSGMLHWWGGAMRFLDDDPAGDVSYFPGTDGLLYWNESMGANPPVLIAEILDLDGNGMIEVADDIPIYQCSLTGMPSAGIDANGNLYVAYSSLVENTTNGDPNFPQSYRNVYVITSVDNGANWSAPVNISDSDFDEAVWPVMGRNVGANADIIYMKDGEPGNSFQTGGSGVPDDPIVNNEIIYNPFPAVTGVKQIANTVENFEVYPNPANELATIKFALNKSSQTKINISNSLGQMVMNIENSQKAAGEHVRFIDLRHLSSGVYFVNIITDDLPVSQKLLVQ